MQRFRVWWNSFKTVAILLSFIINMVLIFVLAIVLMQIFQIKNGILEPLIDGLHRNFVGLDEAVIVRTIDVDDTIPVQFDLPLNQITNVQLTNDVPLVANATFTLPGGGGVINGRVDIVLPKDTILPIQLNMIVPVDTTIPVQLPVDVQIPLKETELHQPFANLRDLLEPYVRILDNLPGDWSDVPDFMIDAIQGDGVYLLSPTEDSQNPWPGPESRNTEAPTEIDETGGEAPPDSLAPPSDSGSDSEMPTPTITPFPRLEPTATPVP